MNIGEYLSSVAEPPATVATVATVEPGGKWIILRVSGARTLALVDSLSNAGYSVWTPRHTQTRRVPRSRAHREQDAALLPTFAFARAEHQSDLMSIVSSPSRRHPQFSIFHYGDGIPKITDASLGSLRVAENRAILRRKVRRASKGEPLAVGAVVDMPEGAFAGLSGTVTESNGKHTMVFLPGWWTEIEVDTSLLRQD